ncbi:MAG: T9SS type A sorting domain-containing protein [Chitinophagales bacterium]|nr:T9SS type A sorting domain-containing protein [Chitinophagales bacterium]
MTPVEFKMRKVVRQVVNNGKYSDRAYKSLAKSRVFSVVVLVLMLLVSSSAKGQFVEIPDPAFRNYLQSKFFTCFNAQNQLDTVCAKNEVIPTIDISDRSDIFSIEGVKYFKCKYLVCPNTSIKIIPELPSTLTHLIAYSTTERKIDSVSPLPSSLRELDVMGNNIKSLNNLPNQLELLACSGNQISVLELPDSLAMLFCGINKLTHLPPLPINVLSIYCHNNFLTELPALNQKVKYINCSNNQITIVPELPQSTEHLFCENNTITRIGKLPSNFSTLRCTGNLLTELPILPNNKLSSLECGDNNIECLPPLPSSLVVLQLLPNSFTCLPNYLSIMDAELLSYPLCIDGDVVNNFYSCAQTNSNERFLFGKVFFDLLRQCSLSFNYGNAKNAVVHISSSHGKSFSVLTDYKGEFRALVDSSVYNINKITLNNYFENTIPNCNSQIEIKPSENRNYELNIGISTDTNICGPYFTVSSNINRLRWCDALTNFEVWYTNYGPVNSTNTYVEVVFDTHLQLNTGSCNIPPIALGNNTYRFNVGRVEPFQTGNITGLVSVNCDSTIVGMTHCMEAHIYPDTLCITQLSRGAVLGIDASCLGDSVQFILRNNGKAMQQQGVYLVYEDDLMIKRMNFQLAQGEFLTERFIANGKTYRMDASLSIDIPPIFGDSVVSAVVEGCEPNFTGNISTGFVNQFPTYRNPYATSKFCVQSVGSYDPNEKLAYPTGYDEQHYILPTQNLQYVLNFQNTGTDTAYRVALVDTLSGDLDVSTFEFVSSSHPCRIDIRNNVLVVKFDTIDLLWQSMDELASQGYFSFRISPRSNLAPQTKIENDVDIYFDRNAPVRTNAVYHTIGENFIRVLSGYHHTAFSKAKVVVAPNPARTFAMVQVEGVEAANLTLHLYDLNGRLLRTQETNGNSFSIVANEWPKGMYVIQVLIGAVPIYSGKLAIE